MALATFSAMKPLFQQKMNGQDGCYSDGDFIKHDASMAFCLSVQISPFPGFKIIKRSPERRGLDPEKNVMAVIFKIFEVIVPGWPIGAPRNG